MCGIVGVASNGPMTVPMKEFFQSLLFHDVVRGPHATGVAAIDTMDRSLVVHKKAVASPVFLSDEPSMDALFNHKHNFNIYIGHNRYATRGAKDKDENAHPFIHGDIVGVHNGSLSNQTLLDGHINFEVDSDNLYHHMNKMGLDDTLKNTDGAFALVWYDRKDNTLNFIRNEERPLAIGKLSNGTWVWASEMGMLKWLVQRHKTLSWATYEEKGVKYNHVFNLEKATHLKVEFKDNSRMYETPRATPKILPVFPTRGYGDYQGGFRSWGYDSGDDNRGNRSTSSTVTHRKTPYEKDVQARLDSFIIGGTVGQSTLEVEFMGHAKERTSGGYEANLSLFKYQSKNGKVVICHAFNHNACLTRDWTESDIGKRVWATISTIPANSISTYNCTRNEELGFALSLTMITTTKPNKYYPFADKKEGESQNVLPFRGAQQQAPATTGEKGSKESQRSGSEQSPVLTEEQAAQLIQDILDKHIEEKGEKVEGIEKGKEVHVLGVTERVLTLANATCTQEEFQDLVNESGGHCSNCCTRMGNIGVSKLHLYEHFDRAVGNTQYFLSCSSKCHKLTVEIMEELDRDYDKFYGGSDA